jgi:hypothetical protein
VNPEEFSMPLPDDVEDLHLIAEYYTARRALRRAGWGAAAWGIVNLCLAAGFIFYLHPINAVLAFISLFLLASGIWCLALPGAEGIIASGIAWCLLGLWNISVFVLNLAAGGTPHFWAIALGVLFIIAAVQSFQKYTRFSKALRHGASKDELAEMDKLVKTVLKANSKQDEDIVGFQVRTFGQQKQWRGMLCRKWAAFVDKVWKEVLVASREEVSIEPDGKVLLGQTLKATVRIRDQKWEALVSPQSFDRFRDWKFEDDEHVAFPADAADAEQAERDTSFRARDARDEEPPTGIARRPSHPEDDQ